MIIERLKTADPERGGDELIFSAMDRPVFHPLVTRRRMVVAALLALLLAAATYAFVRFGVAHFMTVDAERLNIATVRRSVFHDYIPVTGSAVPRTTVYLDAVAGGAIAEIHVEEGASVVAGQPLVALRNANLELDVAGREAALAQQLYQLTTINQALNERRLQRVRDLTEIGYQIGLLTSQRDRKRPLLAGGYVSRQEFDDLERNLAHYNGVYASVQAAQTADDASRPEQVRQLQQSIDLISHNLTMTRGNLKALNITAPISGQLSFLDADLGAVKQQGQRIGQIDSDDGFKVRANVDEFYMARVLPNQGASTRINGKDYALKVSKVYPGIKDRQFAVDLQFIEAPAGIRRGQTLQVKIEIGDPAETLMVDNGAFYDDAAGQWVFLLSPSGDSAVRRAVSFGRRNPDSIEVLQGLQTGDRIIVSTYAPYDDIDRIDIKRKPAEGEKHDHAVGDS